MPVVEYECAAEWAPEWNSFLLILSCTCEIWINLFCLVHTDVVEDKRNVFFSVSWMELEEQSCYMTTVNVFFKAPCLASCLVCVTTEEGIPLISGTRRRRRLGYNFSLFSSLIWFRSKLRRRIELRINSQIMPWRFQSRPSATRTFNHISLSMNSRCSGCRALFMMRIWLLLMPGMFL